MNQNTETIIKTLITVTWADGRVGDEEREIIETLLDAYEVAAPEAEQIRAWAQEKKTLEQVDLGALEESDRALLLQQAVFVTYVDGEQSDQELELLRNLGKRLGIAAERSESLIKATTARAKQLHEENKTAPVSA